MSTKVIIRKKEEKFQWSQTDDAITLYFPVRNVLLKNVDVLYTPEFIKINATSVKFLAIVDFAYPIDHENQKNRIQLQDEGLEVYLMKAESARHQWNEIQVRDMTRADLIKRRDESLQSYYKHEEEKFKEAADKKVKMDKMSVDQQMKVEDFQRKQLKKIKQEQKQLAENELNLEMERLEQINKKLLDQKHQIEDQHPSHNQHQFESDSSVIAGDKVIDKENKQNQSNKVGIDKAVIPEFREQNDFSFKNQKGKDIFGEEDVIETISSSSSQYRSQSNQKPSTTAPSTKSDRDHETYIEEVTEEEAAEIERQQELKKLQAEQIDVPIPQVRGKKDVKVDFTEKRFPHLPARESQMKEPPYPKSKKIDKKQKPDGVYIDIEDKDPLWLKDKGDHFYNRNDYYSAANAYSKALEFDKEFMMGRLNRATAWLKMRAFKNCIDDCTDIEDQINALKESEREDEFYQKMLARLYVKRGAAYNWVSMFDKSIEEFEKATKYKGVFTEQEIQEMLNDIERIRNRQKSQLVKQEGDLKFAHNDLDGALQMYEEALELDDKNEYAHANLGLIYLKRQDYHKCIDYSSRALENLEFFLNETRSFQKDNKLEVKILLRRGKSYENIGDYEKAKEDLDRALSLEPQNGEARTLVKKVQEKLDQILFENYNKQANDFQKAQNFGGALEYYERCLKLTKKATSLDNIAVYVNKIACLLVLEKHERVVQESNDALRLIKNFKNKSDSESSKSQQAIEDKKRLLQMEIRVSVRRGNALAKLSRVSEAITEYEKALKLDPQNETIKKDLDILRRGV